MPPKAHSTLGPSSAARWISCPASVALSAELPERDDSSPYAEEGTAAHALAEIESRYRLLGMDDARHRADLDEWRVRYSADYSESEIMGFITRYVDRVEEALDSHPHSVLLLEQRMDTGVPGCWGTGDAVIVSPEHIHVLDLKYGRGVAVSAEGNPQLRLYALGALNEFGDLLGEVQSVSYSIVQPRLGEESTETLNTPELLEWRDNTVLPSVKLIDKGERVFGPSESACRWCPVAGECRVRRDFLAREEFGDPDLLSDAEIGEELSRVKQLRHWCDSVERAGLDRAYSDGRTIPGWKVVRSNGRRVITDTTRAIELLAGAGHPSDEVSSVKLKGIGELEKLVGKSLSDILGELIIKTEGKPSLVPASDRRRALDPTTSAAEDFS